jgi:hypothetical protein
VEIFGKQLNIGDDFDALCKDRQLRKDPSTGLWIEYGSSKTYFSTASFGSAGGRLSFFELSKPVRDSAHADSVITDLTSILQRHYGDYIVAEDSTILGLHPVLVWRPAPGFALTLSFLHLYHTPRGATQKKELFVLYLKCEQVAATIVPSSRFTGIGMQ